MRRRYTSWPAGHRKRMPTPSCTQTDRQTDRRRDRETETETERGTHTHTHTHTHSQMHAHMLVNFHNTNNLCCKTCQKLLLSWLLSFGVGVKAPLYTSPLYSLSSRVTCLYISLLCPSSPGTSLRFLTIGRFPWCSCRVHVVVLTGYYVLEDYSAWLIAKVCILYAKRAL